MTTFKAMKVTGSRTTRECLPVCPGLVGHRSMGDAEGYAISHKDSGLYVIQGIPEDLYDQVANEIKKIDWDVPKKGIHKLHISKEHRKLREELMALISSRDRSIAQEDRIAEDVDGKRNFGSGAVWGFKRDVVSKELLIEAKTTEKARQSVKVSDLDYLYKEATLKGKTPAFAIEFPVGDVILMPDEVFSPGFFEGKEIEDLGKKSKFFIIKESQAALICPDDRVAKVETPERTWFVISYLSFLELFKAKDVE